MDPADTRPVAPPGDPTPLARIAGDELLELVGEGGMGRVYRARELSPPRALALESLRGLDRAAAQRFRCESELLATLERSGIARRYAAGDTDLGGARLANVCQRLGLHAQAKSLRRADA